MTALSPPRRPPALGLLRPSGRTAGRSPGHGGGNPAASAPATFAPATPAPDTPAPATPAPGPLADLIYLLQQESHLQSKLYQDDSKVLLPGNLKESKE